MRVAKLENMSKMNDLEVARVLASLSVTAVAALMADSNFDAIVKKAVTEKVYSLLKTETTGSFEEAKNLLEEVEYTPAPDYGNW